MVAILNGPVANAYVRIHSPDRKIRKHVVEEIPIPNRFPVELGEMTAELVHMLIRSELRTDSQKEMLSLRTKIDAVALDAYGLPARLENELLKSFEGTDRRVGVAWRHWDLTHPGPGLTLFERVTERYVARSDWVEEVFQPLPPDEAELFEEFGV